MSEFLQLSGEQSDENEEGSKFNELAKLSDKFDPEKARSLVAEEAASKTESMDSGKNIANESKENIPLLLSTEVKEMDEILSPEDAANEYLSLLDELSQDFTNPFFEDRRKGESHSSNHRTVAKLGEKYSNNPHYHWYGYDSTEASDDDTTMLRIASADTILANEIAWRKVGEVIANTNREVDAKIAKLDADYASKSVIGKFFGRKKYNRTRNSLENSRRYAGESVARKSNEMMAWELAYAYNETGNRVTLGSIEGYSPKGRAEAQERNEAQNRRFFGFDDVERAKKVERAIELRQEYLEKWEHD